MRRLEIFGLALIALITSGGKAAIDAGLAGIK
jgi:hypothetical protein